MSERVLILDDEPDFLAFAQAAMAGEGHEVSTLNDPRRLPDTIEAFRPTVIVLDIIMPGLDGIEIITWLAKTGFEGRVVLISGFNPQYINVAEKLASGKGLGGIVSLRKPISPEKLRKAVAGG
jgi:CheY-like chemotaxis protein